MSSPPSSHVHAQCYGFCQRGLAQVSAGELAGTAAVTTLVIVAVVNFEGNLDTNVFPFFVLFPSSHLIVSIFGRCASLSPDVFLHPCNHKRHAPFILHNIVFFVFCFFFSPHNNVGVHTSHTFSLPLRLLETNLLTTKGEATLCSLHIFIYYGTLEKSFSHFKQCC